MGSIKAPIKWVLRIFKQIAVKPVDVEIIKIRKPIKLEKSKTKIAKSIRIIIDNMV